ncbi:MAG: enoyl-CoA hydratase/isomerase family protein [Halioglobus sp.]
MNDTKPALADIKPALILERQGLVAIIVNNDAPMNRMTLEFIDELEVVLPELARDNSVRAIVIRGAEDENFSVGMNLKQLGTGIEQKGSMDGLLDQRLRVLEMIEQMHKPVIAVLCG